MDAGEAHWRSSVLPCVKPRMRLASEIARYSRMSVEMLKLARTPAIADYAENIRRNFENRESNFLAVVRDSVYAYSSNPYRHMLQLARCEYGDLEREVRRKGLESTLTALLDGGVYLTQDEAKGKTPIVRGGELIPSNERSFLNPAATGLQAQSSGSSGRPTRISQSVNAQLHWERYIALMADDLELHGRSLVAMLPILPSLTGLILTARGRWIGWHAERWYSVGTVLDSGHYRAATNVMVLASRLGGSRAPFPRYLPTGDFRGVAEFIARRKAEGVQCYIGGFLSPAVRVAWVAMERGLDIAGTIFSVGGEALTPAKRAIMESVGGRVYPFYATIDVGPVGYSCNRMNEGNCVHFFEDSLAAITRARLAPLSQTRVNSLLFTTLGSYSPRVVINAELDDSGVIEPARCDCVYSRLGLTRQIRDIASFGKVTGQGITLAGTDVVRILEEALPRRLGGGPGDYQIVERDDTNQTVLVLRVSPRTGVSDVARVRDCFLDELTRNEGGSLAARIFRHAEAVRVLIAEPLTTQTGKVLPLHLLGSEESRMRSHEATMSRT